MNEIKEYTEKVFEDIKHIDEFGNEYWLARELMSTLEYSKWQNFHKVIKQAMIACKASNNVVLDQFTEVSKLISGENLKMLFIKKRRHVKIVMLTQMNNLSA